MGLGLVLAGLRAAVLGTAVHLCIKVCGNPISRFLQPLQFRSYFNPPRSEVLKPSLT